MPGNTYEKKPLNPCSLMVRVRNIWKSWKVAVGSEHLATLKSKILIANEKSDPSSSLSRRIAGLPEPRIPETMQTDAMGDSANLSMRELSLKRRK